MPREDRATWKSNYFLKIIVSVGGGLALPGRCAPWAWGRSRPAGSGREPGGRVSGGLNKRQVPELVCEQRLHGDKNTSRQSRSGWFKGSCEKSWCQLQK